MVKSIGISSKSKKLLVFYFLTLTAFLWHFALAATTTTTKIGSCSFFSLHFYRKTTATLFLPRPPASLCAFLNTVNIG